MKTLTVMQDWAKTKRELIDALAAVNAALVEANTIIKDQTGQDSELYDGLKFYNRHLSTHSVYRGAIGFANINGELPEAHLPLSLSESKELLRVLRGMDTGWFISRWEKAQN